MKNKKDLIYIIPSVVIGLFCIIFIAIRFASMPADKNEISGADALGNLLPDSFDYNILCNRVDGKDLYALPHTSDPDGEYDDSDYTIFHLTDNTRYLTETIEKFNNDNGTESTSVSYAALTETDFLKLFTTSDRLYLYIWTDGENDCRDIMIYYE